MKFLFIFLATICFATVNCNVRVFLQSNPTVGSESKSDREMKAMQCAEQYKIDQKMMDDMVKNINFSATDEAKGFAACIAKKSGLMNEDGSLNKIFMNYLDVVKCNKGLEGKEKEPETAAKLVECLLKEDQASSAN